MNDGALLALDEPRPLTPRDRMLWSGGILLYALATVAVLLQADIMLQPVLWVPMAHALVLAMVCAFTGALLVGQASTTGRRGYLWLGSTYLYVAGILLAFPLFFPGAFGGDAPLLGGPQSAVTFFYVWHLAFVGGVIAAMVVLWADQRSHRRPGLHFPVWATLAAVVGAVLITVVVVAQGQTTLPPLIAGDGSLTPLARGLDQALVGLSAAAVIFALLTMWGSAGHIQRWLFALSLLLLGEALINSRSTGRWTLAWYFDRGFALLALSSLFAALVYLLARAGQATNRLAMRDTLTGCESRAAFTRSIERELAVARRDGTSRAVLWVDLDGFKSINDQVGHGVGDEVLRRTVDRLTHSVRPSDRVGRLGGDEFGVLLCDGDADQRSAVIADRLLRALRDPVVVGGSTTLTSASVGIAVGPRDGGTAGALLNSADLAMYAAKTAGGDRWHRFTTSLGVAASHHAELRQTLAIAVRDRSFDVDVQPIVTVSGAAGTVIGVEVLVRRLAGEQRIPAGDFIEFAERSGQIIGIGRLVIERVEAVADPLLATLPATGFVAVNLSVKELSDGTVVDRLLTGPLSRLASRIVLEVTESLELPASAGAEHHLTQLRLRGYKVAVDDFGAGFSNFSRLQRLCPYLLKIDRSLIQRAADSGATAFVGAAVTVAHSLPCRVVAEGIETPAQMAVAQTLDVDLAQGFLLGRPMPVTDWLRDGRSGQAVTRSA